MHESSYESLREGKRFLRAAMKERLDRVARADRSASGLAVAGAVERWEGWDTAATVLSFDSLANEIDTGALHARILAAGKTLGLPRIAEKELVFHRVDEPSGLTRTNRFGINEPAADRPVVEVGSGTGILVLVPGIAFDRAGHRLGRGRGFYDRFLRRLPEAVKMALCFDFQLIDRVPAEEHDIAVDWIATDRRLLRARSES